jgi:2-oxo-4-hydroxy-4-carboxy-5-ureidoimidazoline decarboxylase
MMDKAGFMDIYGHLFEHSPWVVERAWALSPLGGPDKLHAAFMAVLADATQDERLAVLRAHPKLADKAAIAEGLTESSAAEQASAGLTALTPEEFETFHSLNAAYDQRFGFPFVICVRLHTRTGILGAMRARLNSDFETEIAEGIYQVGLISRIRLDQIPAEQML